MLEKLCPKCGKPMYLLPDRDWTLNDIKVVEAICENCLHVERITTVVAKKED